MSGRGSWRWGQGRVKGGQEGRAESPESNETGPSLLRALISEIQPSEVGEASRPGGNFYKTQQCSGDVPSGWICQFRRFFPVFKKSPKIKLAPKPGEMWPEM